jgi:hypothetical protein
LLILFLLKGKKNTNEFKLATEVLEAKSFDDIFIEIHDSQGGSITRLLQAKYRLNPVELNGKMLLSGKDASYKLSEYYSSFQEIEKRIKDVQDVIIATNNTITKTEEQFVVIESGDGNGFNLYLERIDEVDEIFGKSGHRYKISKSQEHLSKNLATLGHYIDKENTDIKNSRKDNKGNKKEVIKYTPELLEKFMEKLLIVVNFTETELNAEILPIFEKDFNLNNTASINSIFESKFMKWFDDLKTDKIFDIKKFEKIYEEIMDEIFVQNCIGITDFLYGREGNIEVRCMSPQIEPFLQDFVNYSDRERIVSDYTAQFRIKYTRINRNSNNKISNIEISNNR